MKAIQIGDEIYIGYKNKKDVYKRVYYDGVKTDYCVSRLGYVYNDVTHHKLTNVLLPGGYYKILIYYTKNGVRTRKQVFVHRLVATAFVKNPNPKKYDVVNHKDGIKTNNDADNLEWVTQSQNALHAHMMGLAKPRFGKYNNFTKFDDNVIKKICLEIQNNTMGFSDIARKYGVSRKLVSKIYYGERRLKISEKYDFSKFNKTRVVSKEIHKKILELIKQGKGAREISEKTGISLSYAHILRRQYKAGKFND